MTIKTAYELRLSRAQKLFAAGAVHLNGIPGSFDVQSQSDPDVVYEVMLHVDEELGWVLESHCECPDWLNMYHAMCEHPMNPGISHVNYSPACKHVLGCLLEMDIIAPPA